MPYSTRYRYSGRRAAPRRKNMYTRPYRSFKRRRNTRRQFAGKVMTFTRRTNTRIEVVADTVVTGVLQYKLDNLPSYVEYTALFSEYKLVKIVHKIRWSNQLPTRETAMVPVTQCCPNFYYVTTQKDAAPIASMNNMLEVSEHKMVPMTGQSITVTVRPYFDQSVYLSSVSSGYGGRRGWISCLYPGVPHNALKFLIDGTLNGGTGGLQLGKMLFDTVYHFQCRGTK